MPCGARELARKLQDLLGLSGHTAEMMGPLVIQSLAVKRFGLAPFSGLRRGNLPRIGGMKNMVAPDELINVTVINLHRNTISRPSLKEDPMISRIFFMCPALCAKDYTRTALPLCKDSLKPLQRMRHATCVVKTKHLPASEA